MLIDLPVCVYCASPREALDHVVPLSQRRPHDDRLMVSTCRACNNVASDRVFDSFEDKAKYLLSVATKQGRVIWNKLPQTVNTVNALLLQRDAGNDSALPNADISLGRCKTCGISIESSTDRRRRNQYCSPRCSEVATRERRRELLRCTITKK